MKRKHVHREQPTPFVEDGALVYPVGVTVAPSPRMPLKLYVGDVVEMRKPHACGGRVWRVLRVGADIGMECETCHRYVLLPRRRFEARVKRFLQRGAAHHA